MADPYETLGVRSDVPDADLRAAYRRLVQLHHPDHNGGSAESARRFEAVQEAYAQIRTMRQRPGSPRRTGSGAGPAGPATANADPQVESRLADLERELNAAREARERARRAAREAASAGSAGRAGSARSAGSATTSQQESGGASGRPSAEDLGYIETDDSFTKILADATAEISERLSDGAHELPKHVPKRVSDLIDELASKLTGEPPTR